MVEQEQTIRRPAAGVGRKYVWNKRNKIRESVTAKDGVFAEIILCRKNLTANIIVIQSFYYIP